MGKHAMIFFVEVMKLLPAAALWKIYGVAMHPLHAVQIFLSQSEISQIGTLFCIVLLVDVTTSGAKSVLRYLYRTIVQKYFKTQKSSEAIDNETNQASS